MTTPYVSVIIPTYQDWERLRSCLDALQRQTYPAERFEVIVVDNVADSVPPFAPPAPNIIFLSEPERGSYAARNTGLRHARGEIVAFTDSDCIPAPNWIEQAVTELGLRPEIDRLAGRVKLFVAGAETPSSLYEQVFAFWQERHAAMGTSVTANMISRRRVFDHVGPFDGTMESGEDIRWGFRAKARGFPLAYAPSVVVAHPARATWSDLAKKARRVYRGIYRIQGWGGKPLVVRLAAGLLALRPPVFDTWRIFRTRDISFGQKLSVVTVLVRLRWLQFTEHVNLSIKPVKGQDAPSSSGAAR